MTLIWLDESLLLVALQVSPYGGPPCDGFPGFGSVSPLPSQALDPEERESRIQKYSERATREQDLFDD